MLNLGCGYNYNQNWVNVDFIKTGDTVITHNLLEGIPFMINEFDVVYHSHLLEHFPKKEALTFLRECNRVLKPGGIIRIVVPDLEAISQEYLRNLDRAINNGTGANSDYDWIMLEMYDQTMRNSSGGEMAHYLNREEIPNKEYVFNRIGDEGRILHEKYTNNKEGKITVNPNYYSLKFYVKRIAKVYKSLLLKTKDKRAMEIGRFRLSGEVHQWMYDHYSLRKILQDSGFKNIRKLSAFDSEIKDWNSYQLDSSDAQVRKPDSLFMEATK